MRRLRLRTVLGTLFMIPLLFVSVHSVAQEVDPYEKAKAEVIKTFGSFPDFNSYTSTSILNIQNFSSPG
ncbi:MAG TPA: hypothetical protein VGA21_11475 [Cyclobacteriaceae bacterium]